ncbi:restriction endonuclease subunit S [Streptococcus suis]|uniref:restriction endonuclease subunit S n=2 Tax=Streptococcus suis TaxID=1307 RepID=UPI002A89B525|nr:restriction endonuclease subunit S [Streptococcus suis]HEP1570147.1 restriction endonuclease subunit S [Streptococcus suis]
MNYIEKMLQDYCPNGVEWKELGEVCVVKTGQQINKTFIQNNLGRYPVVNSGKEPLGFVNVYNTEDDPIGITSRGAGVGYVSWNEGKYFRGNLNYSSTIKDSNVILPKFLYYFLKNSSKAIENLCTFEGIPALNKSNLEMLKIPIPPLEIQKEIVALLDKFTEYVTELTAELTDRQKQYSFYRDKLLSFEDEIYRVEWKTLGELFEFKNGLNKGKEFFGRGTPIVNYTDVYKNIRLTSAVVKGTVEVSPEEQKRYNVRRGDVFFTRTSETKEEIGKTSVLLEDIDGGVFSGFVLRARPKTDSLLPEYCAHCFNSSSFRKEIVRYSTYTTRALTNGSTLAKLTIPLPPLPIQERIVQVLDNFDAVCNDLNIGLPKEIELRQKQYEYFREKLLTFTAEGVYPGQWTVDSERGPSDLIRLLQWVFGTIRVELGAVASVVRGKRLVRKELSQSEGYPVYQNSLNALGYYKDWNTEANTAFIISAGAAGEVGYSNQNFWKADDVWTIETAVISQRFIFHVLSQKKDLLKSQVRKASVPRLSKTSIENLSFILPSLEEQSCIVAILDKFDELTNSISQGLPKEIELRQKQYEYFRDTLLSFPNKYD